MGGNKTVPDAQQCLVVLKRCSKCGEEKPLTGDNWGRKSCGYFRSICRPCCAEYLRQWRKTNKDKLRKYGWGYRQEHKAEKQETNRRYREKHKDKIKEKERDARRELTGKYIRKLLVQNSSLHIADIPQELVELHRIQLLLKRELKTTLGG